MAFAWEQNSYMCAQSPKMVVHNFSINIIINSNININKEKKRFLSVHECLHK